MDRMPDMALNIDDEVRNSIEFMSEKRYNDYFIRNMLSCDKDASERS